MEVKNCRIDMSEATMQVLRTTCPYCSKPVDFMLSSEDRLYKQDAKHYQERCDSLAEEVDKLNKILDLVLISKRT